MKRTFLLEELDCAHCAQKIQDGVSKLDGVKDCKVKFLTTKLEYEVEDDKDSEVEAKMKEIVKGVDPDIEIVAK